MSRRKAEMILELIDRATRPARRFMRLQERMGRASAASSRMAGRASRVHQRATDALANSQKRLNSKIERTNGLLDRQKDRMRKAAFSAVAIGTALAGLTEPAIRAEVRLAEISKVIDFNEDNGFRLLQEDIRNLVTDGGLATTASAVEDIVAAAGRMGVVDANLPDAQKRAELLEFATSASMMAVAFGVSADEAGMALARWRQNLGLSQDEAMLLGDTVNLLGNTMATNEADIMQVINRQGVVAKSAGLAASEIAALSATILASGASPEIAALTEELQELGLPVGHRRVGRLMGENGIKIIRTQKYKATTDSNHTFNIAPNLLDQDFSATGPNQKWAGDISYIWTSEGWLYLAVILDLYSRRVIGGLSVTA